MGTKDELDAMLGAARFEKYFAVADEDVEKAVQLYRWKHRERGFTHEYITKRLEQKCEGEGPGFGHLVLPVSKGCRLMPHSNRSFGPPARACTPQSGPSPHQIQSHQSHAARRPGRCDLDRHVLAGRILGVEGGGG